MNPSTLLPLKVPPYRCSSATPSQSGGSLGRISQEKWTSGSRGPPTSFGPSNTASLITKNGAWRCHWWSASDRGWEMSASATTSWTTSKDTTSSGRYAYWSSCVASTQRRKARMRGSTTSWRRRSTGPSRNTSKSKSSTITKPSTVWITKYRRSGTTASLKNCHTTARPTIRRRIASSSCQKAPLRINDPDCFVSELLEQKNHYFFRGPIPESLRVRKFFISAFWRRVKTRGFSSLIAFALMIIVSS